MLTIETSRRKARAIPGLIRIGLVVLVVAGFADVTAHLMAAQAGQVTSAAHGSGHAGGHTPDELAAHVAVLVGMVLILLGVVVDGVKQTRLGQRVGGE